MLPSAKNARGTTSKVPSKREEKKQINIRWNSRIFFQLGLAFSLFLFLVILESDWEMSSGKSFTVQKGPDWEEPPLMAFKVETPVVETKNVVKNKITRRVIKPAVTNTFTVTPDDDGRLETPSGPTELSPDEPITGTVMTTPSKTEVGPKSINEVQFVPIFPGCEGLSSNAERKQCMSQSINKFINRKFNSSKFSGLERGKTHTISVRFTVDKQGAVKDVKARAARMDLETEASRVIHKMPIMSPGRQGDIPVDVVFFVPISFQVQ